MDLSVLTSLVGCLVLATAIVYMGQLDFLGRSPRHHWLSLASGVTVGYVFLGLLPKLITGDAKVEHEATGVLALVEDHVLLLAMFGLVAFYGMALAAQASRRAARERVSGDDEAHAGTFWPTVALHALYLVFIGYLVEGTFKKDVVAAVVLVGALTIHFATTDFGMRRYHSDELARYGRWVLAAALLAGWAIALVTKVDPVVVAAASAFVAGTILINVLNDELPDEREARFLPFAAGALASALLFATIG